MTSITQAPVYALDRAALVPRSMINFLDYGFVIDANVTALFDVVPSVLSDEECFLFLFARDDVKRHRWALFNLHVFLKRTGNLEDFAHGLGDSMRNVVLSPAMPFGLPGLGYSRTIAISDLFKGGEHVITFIGADPSWQVYDSHNYFRHQHAHAYSGMIYHVGEDEDHYYTNLRTALFDGVRFVD